MDMKNRYEGKLFSILGDSISTLEGYSEPEDTAFYTGIAKCQADIFAPEDTWWGQVLEHLGGELLVNNSFSGSLVTKRHDCIYPSYGCSDERTSALGRMGQTPDVIMVYMGTNDWGWGMDLQPENEEGKEDISAFSVAYDLMLRKLRENYPEAELWCFTIAVCAGKDTGDSAFRYRRRGRHVEAYCDVIREAAETHGCRLIDLYQNAKPYDTIDDAHPSVDGMKTLAETVIALL